MAKKTGQKKTKKRTKKVVSKAAKPASNKEQKPKEDKGGLTIKKDKGHKSAKIKPGKRLYLNAAKDTLYPEGHEKAATLYCTEHKSVPRKEYQGFKKGK